MLINNEGITMIYFKYCSIRHFVVIVAIGLFPFISGCGFKTDQYSHDILISPTSRKVPSNPNDLSITYDYKMKPDGYIVGIEKTRGVGNYLTKCSDKSFEKQHSSLCETVSSHSHSIWVPDFLEKRMTLTHVVSFSSNAASPACILFNANSNKSEVKSNLAPCPNAKINPGSGKFEYMEEAINSIDLLKSDMRAKINKIHPTHIFLVSTGWNTPQGESIQNYNDLFKYVIAADKNEKGFVPLVVGFSWKSYMDNVNQGTVDVGVVGNDADEVGIFWAGPILHKVLEPLGTEYRIPVRLIGHSFGCRVVTQALSSKELYEDTPGSSSKPVTYGLQCAFSGNRFAPKKGFWATVWKSTFGENDSLENFNEVSEKQFYTTSDLDKAVQEAAGIGIPYVGSKEFFKITGEDTDFKKIITRSTIEAPDIYVPKLDCNGDKITLINASKIIKDRAPGTGEGGGAHSDVWDAEAGDLIWDLLKACENK